MKKKMLLAMVLSEEVGVRRNRGNEILRKRSVGMWCFTFSIPIWEVSVLLCVGCCFICKQLSLTN